MLPELRESLKQDFFVLAGPWENHLGDSSGWEPLIRQLAEEISPSLEASWAAFCPPDSGYIPPRITRLAVETGGLKVYMTWIPEELDEEITQLIDKAEMQSFQICIDGGQPGSLRVEDELVTLGDDCTTEIYYEEDDDDDDPYWDDDL